MKKAASVIKKILLVIIAIIALIVFLTIRIFAPSKEEKKLISYLKEHEYNCIELKSAKVDTSNINVQFAIKSKEHFLEEAIDVKKRIESYAPDEYTKSTVNVDFDFDGISTLHFSNRPDYTNWDSEIPQGRRLSNKLIYAQISNSELWKDNLAPLKECYDVKVIELLNIEDSKQISVIKDMKNLSLIRIVLSDKEFNKDKIKKELQASHPDCIVEVK